MRLTLKWKVAAAYSALIVLMCVGLNLVVRQTVSDAMTTRLREDLSGAARLIRAAIDRAEPGADLEDLVADLSARCNARVTLVAPNGRVLADSAADPETMEPHDTRIEIVEARQTGLAWSVRPSATVGIPMLYVAESAGPDKPTVRLAMPLSGVRHASAGITGTILTIALITALLAVLAAVWLAGGITRSLADVADVARRIGSGDMSARARVDARDETSDVAIALNTMAENLEQTRRRLQERSAYLSSVLDNMADGVIVVGTDETIQLFNPAAASLLSVAPGEALGRHINEVVKHYELRDMVRRSLRLRTLVQGEVRIAAADHRHVAAATSPVEGEDGQIVGAVASLRDITEIKRLQLVRQDFVANAGHELRTPVAAIRSLAETLHSGAISDSAAAPRFVEQIVENTVRLERLINDMMALARMEAAPVSLAPGSVNVRRLMESTLERLAPQAHEKGLHVSIEVPDDLTVWGQEDSLAAALVNLLDNAIKYTPAEGRVTLEARSINGTVELVVADTGPGIPYGDRERIFERFYRVDRARSRALGGTGLGLSIVKHAVESNRGKVWVECPDEGGSRFIIHVPASAPSDSELRAESS
ncbi:MAG: PAS domain S-box protein [Armatimonadetes bacterium]|nr:PAS domain S-box protein [Armatimonadota bacterium]